MLYFKMSFLRNFCFTSMMKCNFYRDLIAVKLLKLRLNMSFLQRNFLEYCSVTCFILRVVSFSTVIAVNNKSVIVVNNTFMFFLWLLLLMSRPFVSVVFGFHTNFYCILALNLISCISNILFRLVAV